MAKYYSSTFGKISGKHGTAVAVIMKDGSTYLREYRKPSNPRTDKQQAHRAKFALSSKALVPFNPIFKETMGVTNGISMARSHAFKNAIVGNYPSFSMDYEKLMFSFGALEGLHNASATSNESVVSLKWDFKKMYNCHASDSISLVVFNKDNNQSAQLKDIALRSDKKCRVDIPEGWANNELYLWAYVTCGDNKSDSTFVDKLNSRDGEKCESVGTDMSVCPEDNKQLGLSSHNGVSQIVMFLLVVLNNLFCFIKQVGTDANIQNSLNTLIYRASSATRHIYSSYKIRMSILNFNSALNTLFEELYGLYKIIFVPSGIPIMRPNYTYALIARE